VPANVICGRFLGKTKFVYMACLHNRLHGESPRVNHNVYFSREGSIVTPFLPHCFNALGMVPMPFGKLVRRGWERLERRAVNCGEHVLP
jgi:hypothetical protein